MNKLLFILAWQAKLANYYKSINQLTHIPYNNKKLADLKFPKLHNQ